MTRTAAPVRFQAVLHRPRQPGRAAWCFLVLPKSASAKLPTRSMTSVKGTLEGQPFASTLAPDGNGSHWLKVGKALRDKAGVAAGDTVSLDIAPVAVEPEPRVPADVRSAFKLNAAAKATWDDITAVARRDWIHWITSGKKAETRIKRVAVAIDKLARGHRRACCFDRSGMVSRGAMGAPEAAE